MNFKEILSSKKILYNIDIVNFISSHATDNLSIIYFVSNLNSKIEKLSLYKNNIIYISEENISNSCLCLKQINNKIIKLLKHKFIIAIDIDNNVSFNYMKYLINNLIRLFTIIKKHNIEFSYNYNDFTISGILSCPESNRYFNDICTAMQSLLTSSKKEQYEIIYDYVCTYLDNEFINKNICGFCDDICNASRAGLTKYKFNGCCYTIEYGTGGLITNHKPCKYLVNRHCVANCISCKLHTCYYLKAKNIEFKIKNILLLNCFFSYKQYFVLKYNVFKTKEEILKKLLQVKFIPSIIYYPFSLYKIN